MSIINYASREIQFKIVYYGPALCGKTTNLDYIHQRISPKNRGELVSLATAADRTLFFDFLPLNAIDDRTHGGLRVPGIAGFCLLGHRFGDFGSSVHPRARHQHARWRIARLARVVETMGRAARHRL